MSNKELTNIALQVLAYIVILPARPFVWLAIKIEPWTVDRLIHGWSGHVKKCRHE